MLQYLLYNVHSFLSTFAIKERYNNCIEQNMNFVIILNSII